MQIANELMPDPVKAEGASKTEHNEALMSRILGMTSIWVLFIARSRCDYQQFDMARRGHALCVIIQRAMLRDVTYPTVQPQDRLK